jgi:hypothetical protein
MQHKIRTAQSPNHCQQVSLERSSRRIVDLKYDEAKSFNETSSLASTIMPNIADASRQAGLRLSCMVLVDARHVLEPG